MACNRVPAVFLTSFLVLFVVSDAKIWNCYCECMVNSCMTIPGNTIEICDPACTDGCSQAGLKFDKGNNDYCGTQNPPPSKLAALQNPPPSNFNAAAASTPVVVGSAAKTTAQAPATSAAAATHLPSTMLSLGLKSCIMWWMAMACLYLM